MKGSPPWMKVSTPWKKANILVLDLETTGLSNDDEIIQIGMVRSNHGCVFSQSEILVNPLRLSHPGALQVHGITDDMVSWRPPIQAIKNSLNRILNSTEGIIAHNAEFDLRFIRKIKGLKVDKKIPYLCTQRYAKSQKLKGNLFSIAKACGIKVDENSLHGALYDAQITHQLFLKLIPDLFLIGTNFHGVL